MTFSVAVENAVDTGVGTHADILALGHLLPPSRILGPISNQRGNRRARGQRKDRESQGDYRFQGVSWKGYKGGRGGHRVVGGKERGWGILSIPDVSTQGMSDLTTV